MKNLNTLKNFDDNERARTNYHSSESVMHFKARGLQCKNKSDNAVRKNGPPHEPIRGGQSIIWPPPMRPNYFFPKNYPRVSWVCNSIHHMWIGRLCYRVSMLIYWTLPGSTSIYEVYHRLAWNMLVHSHQEVLIWLKWEGKPHCLFQYKEVEPPCSSINLFLCRCGVCVLFCV